MSLFHTTTYNLYNKDNLKICVISDIHFSDKLKNKKLNKIVNYIKKIKPNYILIPGDFIDSTDDIEEEVEETRFLDWINKLSNIIKVIISIGNHDVTKEINKENKYNYNKEFFDKLNSIKNVYLLDNNAYEDNYIYVCGITLIHEYYFTDDKEILINELDKNKRLFKKTDKLSFLMIHSPVNLDNKEISDKLNSFDYFITGHMHNGCVPPIINEIWKSNRGIITPIKKLFKKNTRNTLKNKDDKLLINGPVTTFSKASGIFRGFNFLYPIYITVMNFNKKNEFKITKKYHK